MKSILIACILILSAFTREPDVFEFANADGEVVAIIYRADDGQHDFASSGVRFAMDDCAGERALVCFHSEVFSFSAPATQVAPGDPFVVLERSSDEITFSYNRDWESQCDGVPSRRYLIEKRSSLWGLEQSFVWDDKCGLLELRFIEDDGSERSTLEVVQNGLFASR